MTNDEIKSYIATKVAEGISLSKIQDMLLSEKKVRMTYMELRMLASEIESADWKKLDKVEKEPAKTKPETPADEENAIPEDDEAFPDANAENAPAGKTVVELSKLVKPGTVANGSVKFGSGATADWYLDQTGRLGLSNATGKPTETDVMEFQVELQKLFGGN